MSGLRGEVLNWFDAGRVAPDHAQPVLRAAGLLPVPADWIHFLAKLTLWLGTVALATSVIFFFAFNWDDLGRFAKFGLVEAAILIALLVCWRIDLDGKPGKAVLLLLSLLTGALLALTGQTYQTGADTYELFTLWAVLILPWVLVSRFSPLWLLWLALLNIGAFLYFALSSEAQGLLWTLFGLNGLALILWEAAHRRALPWLQDSWPPRLVAIASGAMATALMISAITDNDDGALAMLGALAYCAWIACAYFWYRRVRPDPFMLAGGLLSLIVIVATFLSKHMLSRDESFAFLFIGLVVIGMSAGGALWLKSVVREQRA